jgi:hypothetical protein
VEKRSVTDGSEDKAFFRTGGISFFPWLVVLNVQNRRWHAMPDAVLQNDRAG